MAIHLTSLPVDIKMAILESIGSPRELHTLICASSDFYRIYLLNRERYIRASIASEYPAELLRELVAVHLATVLFVPVVTADQARRMPALVEAFLGEYFDRSTEWKLPTTRTELRAILRLSGKIRYFTEKSALHALREAKALRKGHNRPFKHDSCDATSVVHLSSSERFRFYRGLLRFQLLSTVFRMPRRRTERLWYSPRMIDRLFLNNIQSWEAEEIFCIRRNFELLPSESLYHTDRKFEVAVRSVAIDEDDAAAPPSPDSTRTPTSGSPRPFDVVTMSPSVAPRLWIFFPGRKAYWDELIDVAVLFGLDYMFAFTQHDRRNQFNMLRNGYFWTRSVPPYGKPLQQPFNSHCCDSAGFLRYYQSRLITATVYDPERHVRPLRSIGLVFWDADRIDTYPIRGATWAACEQSFSQRYEPFRQRWNRYPSYEISKAQLQFRYVKALEKAFGTF